MIENSIAVLVCAAAISFTYHVVLATEDRVPIDVAMTVAHGGEDTGPEEMEAALTTEQARQDALQALQEQLSGPLTAFDNAYDATLSRRAQIVVEAISAALKTEGCNVALLEQAMIAPDVLVTSAALRAGKDELTSVLMEILDDGKIVEVEFASSSPPPVTEGVIAEIRKAFFEIALLNEQHALACVQQERVLQLPVSRGPEMILESAKLQNEQAELAKRLEDIVQGMNGRIDAIDQPLVEWIAGPLRDTQAGE
ncbi:MAG TPA: hypothetical protein VGO22_10855 [Pseudorhizobium sp.]|jgi:hypothetical protein|nr:hypothetical protein [Pseudorhizobium sp.]